MAFTTRHAHPNALWASLIIEELVRLGLRDCCIAPGSRSTPLTIAAAKHSQLRTHIHFDERGLGFHALGLAKASRRPVALITTSGTAVANLCPAIIEASLTGVPLIVLSADRPPHLVGCGANQAIEQPRLFADYPRWQTQLPVPATSVPAQYLLTTLATAWQHTQGDDPGPVHLNCPFDEPLYPAAGQSYSDYLTPLSRWLGSDRPWSQWHSSHSDRSSKPYSLSQASLPWQEIAQSQGLIIAGQLASDEDALAVAELARLLGWPLVADLQSRLRTHPDALSCADLLLHSPGVQQQLTGVRVVLQFGSRLLSKRWLGWLKQQPLDHYWLADPHARRLDPDHLLHQRFVAPVSHWCRQAALCLAEQISESSNSNPLHNSLTASAQQLEQQLTGYLSGQQAISEAAVARTLPALLPAGHTLFVGNSLAPRLLDMLSPPRPHSPLLPVITNRGASGIDGLIATACGVAAASEQPVTLLLGDLSFLYDLNSLALLRALPRPPVIVLLNNDGGSIFRLLPGPGDADIARDCYQLPHGLNARSACDMFGIHYQAPGTIDEFERAYLAAVAAGTPQLVEVIVPCDGSEQDVRQIAAISRQIPC